MEEPKVHWIEMMMDYWMGELSVALTVLKRVDGMESCSVPQRGIMMDYLLVLMKV